MGIPVYLSRHSDLPEDYGALVSWEIGQRCQFEDGGTMIPCTIASETMEHREAPVIAGAMGEGKWIREVRFDDGEMTAVSEDRLRDVEAT